MTAVEKFALAKAFHDNAMSGYAPQAQSWIRQQFDCCMRAVLDVVCKNSFERHFFEWLVRQDNWIAQDNPFKDD